MEGAFRAIECRLAQMNVFSHYCLTFSANDCVFSLNEQQKVYMENLTLVPSPLRRVIECGLTLYSIHLYHLRHLIDTYITDLLVSFQLKLGPSNLRSSVVHWQ